MLLPDQDKRYLDTLYPLPTPCSGNNFSERPVFPPYELSLSLPLQLGTRVHSYGDSYG